MGDLLNIKAPLLSTPISNIDPHLQRAPLPKINTPNQKKRVSTPNLGNQVEVIMVQGNHAGDMRDFKKKPSIAE